MSIRISTTSRVGDKIKAIITEYACEKPKRMTIYKYEDPQVCNVYIVRAWFKPCSWDYVVNTERNEVIDEPYFAQWPPTSRNW